MVVMVVVMIVTKTVVVVVTTSSTFAHCKILTDFIHDTKRLTLARSFSCFLCILGYI